MRFPCGIDTAQQNHAVVRVLEAIDGERDHPPYATFHKPVQGTRFQVHPPLAWKA